LRIRSDIDIPVLMLTARTKGLDKICGLGLGADDNIAKPFFLPERMARVKANIAQHERVRDYSDQTAMTADVAIGEARLNPQAKWYMQLIAREFAFCDILWKTGIVFISKKTLCQRNWGMDKNGCCAKRWKITPQEQFASNPCGRADYRLKA